MEKKRKPNNSDDTQISRPDLRFASRENSEPTQKRGRSKRGFALPHKPKQCSRRAAAISQAQPGKLGFFFPSGMADHALQPGKLGAKHMVRQRPHNDLAAMYVVWRWQLLPVLRKTCAGWATHCLAGSPWTLVTLVSRKNPETCKHEKESGDMIKGSLGGETSVLRTFRMSGKELVKERVSKERLRPGKS